MHSRPAPFSLPGAPPVGAGVGARRAARVSTLELRPSDFHARLRRHRPARLGRRWRAGPGHLVAMRLAVLALALTLCLTGYAWRDDAGARVAAAPQWATMAPAPLARPLAFIALTSKAAVPLLPLTLQGAGPAAHTLALPLFGPDHARALACLTSAIYYEAGNEPEAGQRAVAQVVLNRLAHPAYPKTVCGVVYQGSEHATGCQFTFTCDGALARVPAPAIWRRAEALAAQALAGHVFAPIGLATHYHTFAVHPAWADSLDFIGQIGAHRFYRLPGPAGAPTAFRLAYAGSEPVPGPHPRAAGASADPAADPISIEHRFGLEHPVAAPAEIQRPLPAPEPADAPSYTGALLARGGDTRFRASNLPEARGIKPAYENSGRWIGSPQ